jgi:hypothetical protein
LIVHRFLFPLQAGRTSARDVILSGDQEPHHAAKSFATKIHRKQRDACFWKAAGFERANAGFLGRHVTIFLLAVNISGLVARLDVEGRLGLNADAA